MSLKTKSNENSGEASNLSSNEAVIKAVRQQSKPNTVCYNEEHQVLINNPLNIIEGPSLTRENSAGQKRAQKVGLKTSGRDQSKQVSHRVRTSEPQQRPLV